MILPPGSWIHTARYVHVKDHVVTCELKTKNKKWVRSSFIFKPDCMYTNIDGRIHCGADEVERVIHCGADEVERVNDNGILPHGSWVRTARNIDMDGRAVSCELQKKDQSWVKNIFHAFRGLRYSNSDGRIQWEGCTNGAVLDDISHESILKRYVPVTVQECLNHKIHDYCRDWFTIEEEHVQKTADVCVSLSLFRKNVDNRYEDQFPVNVDLWTSKYWNTLVKNLECFPFKEMCVNLYLANDLRHLIPELTRFSFVNVYLMKSESIGAQPGMLWRFLDITNKSYRSVYVLDIDDAWRDSVWLQKYVSSKFDAQLYTLVPGDRWITTNPFQPAINNATIIGSHIKCNPSKFDWDIREVMLGFISFCRARQFSDNPTKLRDSEPATYWNQPVVDWGAGVMSGCPFGWGKLVTVYGFDELFLKHVVYHDAYPDVQFV